MTPKLHTSAQVTDVGAPPQGSEPPVVLCTDRLSPSIEYRPFSEPIGVRPFLEWWCDRFRSRYGSELYILCHTVADERAVAAIVDSRAQIIRVDSGTKVKAFAKAAQLVAAKHVAFVYYGNIFAPGSLLPLNFTHHLHHGNAYTPVLGLPARTAPEIYDTAFLLELASLDIPEMASEPADIVGRLSVVAKSLKELQPCVPTAIPFDASRVLGARPRLLPEGISISTPRDIELARRVVACESSDDGFEDLHNWRRCAIQMRRELEEDFSQFLASAGLSIAYHARPDGRLRVLFVSEPAGFSGGEESLCQLIDHLDRNAFEAYALVGGEGAFAARLRSSGANVIVASCGFGTSSVERLLYVLRRVLEVKPHFVHFNGPVDSPTLHAVFLTQVPFVAHARNALLTDDVDMFRRATRIIAVSEFMKERVLRLEIPEERVSVVYDEVDPDVFTATAYDKNDLRGQYGIPTQAKVALMIARLVPNKRHDLFLKAAFEAKTDIPQLHLLLKGDVFVEDVTPDRVVDYIDTHGMRSWVTIVPFVDDIRKMHSIADVLVLCSDDEALGRCVVEAMAMEVPVIVSDSGGSHEIVRDRETGFVFSGGDVNALRRCLIEALSENSRYHHLRRAARNYVLDHLTARESAINVMALYEQMLSAEMSNLGTAEHEHRYASGIAANRAGASTQPIRRHAVRER